MVDTDKKIEPAKVTSENNKDEEKEHSYKTIDIKFVGKYKKNIIDRVYTFAEEYLKLIRPSNEKNVSVDAHSKDQIMYIFCKLIKIAKKMEDDSPKDIAEWVKHSLYTSSSNYKIYMFLQGVTHGQKYNFIGNIIEEEIPQIISNYIEDEEIMQHIVEMFLLFIKKFAESIANFNWESTKRTNSIQVNGLLRNMNRNNTNPDIFDEIYEFANYCKSQK